MEFVFGLVIGSILLALLGSMNSKETNATYEPEAADHCGQQEDYSHHIWL